MDGVEDDADVAGLFREIDEFVLVRTWNDIEFNDGLREENEIGIR